MNKTELIKKVSHLTGDSQVKTEDFLNALVESIKNELKTGGNIAIRNFGTFEVKKHKEKTIKSNFNGSSQKFIPAHGAVKFVVSKELKNSVKDV